MSEGNLYEGKPDARQGDTETKTSRFRPRYRALYDEEKALHDQIKQKAEELESLFDQIAPGRYLSLAHTSLEEAVMWGIKQLTGSDGGLKK